MSSTPKSAPATTMRWIDATAAGMRLMIAITPSKDRFLVMENGDAMPDVMERLDFVGVGDGYWAYPSVKFDPYTLRANIPGSVEKHLAVEDIVLKLSVSDARHVRLSEALAAAEFTDVVEAGRRSKADGGNPRDTVESRIPERIPDAAGVPAYDSETGKLPEPRRRSTSPDQAVFMAEIAKALAKKHSVVVAPFGDLTAVVRAFCIPSAMPEVAMKLFDIDPGTAAAGVAALGSERAIFADPPPLMVSPDHDVPGTHDIAPALVALWEAGAGIVFDDIGEHIGDGELGCAAIAVEAEITARTGVYAEIDRVYADKETLFAWADEMLVSGNPLLGTIGRQVKETDHHFQGPDRPVSTAATPKP